MTDAAALINPPKRTERLAVAALVLALFGWCGLAFLAWMPAIICGHIARYKIRHTEDLAGKGLATTGLVLAYLGMMILLVAVVLFVMAVCYADEGFLDLFLNGIISRWKN